MAGFAQDIRSAVRSLLRAPAFTAASVVTLALGIGAVTAIFAIVNAVMLRPLPYPEADRIAALVVATPDASYHGGRDYVYLNERMSSVEAIAAFSFGTGWNLSTGDAAEYVSAMPVSAGFFDVFGVRPLLGRSFTVAEDLPNGPDAVLISEDLWRRTFGASPGAVGEIVSLGGTPHTIVGVMPASFRSIPDVDTWTPLRATPGSSGTNDRIVVRLAAGATLAQANAELDTLRAGLLELPRYNEERAAALRWIPYRQVIGAGARGTLLLLLGAVGFLLLIACLNVAGLQTARAVERRDEMATRAALGAGRGRLMRRALVEALVLALAGAGAGLGLAVAGISALARITPLGLFEDLTSGQPTSPDWRVIAMLFVTAAIAGLVFGAFPATVAAGARIRTTTSGGTRSTTGRSGVWLRRVFTTAQVALAVILLVGAGLFARTMARMASVDPGFEAAGVVVAKMSLQGDGASDPDRLNDLITRGMARLGEIPGVTAVAVSNSVPVEGGLNLPLEPPAGAVIEERRAVDWHYVTPSYFGAFRMPIVAGRAFDSRDAAGSQPVAIVSEAFARTYFGPGSALGRQVQLVADFGDPAREIVGIVADVSERSRAGWVQGLTGLTSPPSPTLYVPVSQAPAAATRAAHQFFPMSWVLRTTGPVPPLAREAAAAMAAVDPALPFLSFETMDAVIASDLDFHRFLTTLIGVFSAVAVLLAAVGLYGLIAYTVSRRAHETGIRLALGATGIRVVRGFMAEGIVLVAVGVVVGLGGAALLLQAVESLLFGVSPLDAVTFAGVAALLAAVALVATSLPASRAARTDPAEALRAE